ncbi:hypothetical protein WDU94_005084 [Cyamophila willieti]
MGREKASITCVKPGRQVIRPSIIHARRRLTSVIRREPVYSTCYRPKISELHLYNTCKLSSLGLDV